MSRHLNLSMHPTQLDFGINMGGIPRATPLPVGMSMCFSSSLFIYFLYTCGLISYRISIASTAAIVVSWTTGCLDYGR